MGRGVTQFLGSDNYNCNLFLNGTVSASFTLYAKRMLIHL